MGGVGALGALIMWHPGVVSLKSSWFSLNLEVGLVMDGELWLKKELVGLMGAKDVLPDWPNPKVFPPCVVEFPPIPGNNPPTPDW